MTGWMGEIKHFSEIHGITPVSIAYDPPMTSAAQRSGPARDAVFVAIDFETTGVVGEFSDEPWQIGMVRIDRGRVVAGDTVDQYLRIGPRPFAAAAPGRHAEVRGELVSAPTLSESWPAFHAWWLGAPLVAHNAATERRLLQKTAPLHRFDRWIDTLTLSRVAYPDLSSHALGDVLASLGLVAEVEALCPDRTFHDALFDAVGSAVLLVHFLAQDGWQDATVDDLMAARAEAYYRRRGS